MVNISSVYTAKKSVFMGFVWGEAPYPNPPFHMDSLFFTSIVVTYDLGAAIDFISGASPQIDHSNELCDAFFRFS